MSKRIDMIDLAELRARATDRIFGLPESHQLLLVDRHHVLALIAVVELLASTEDVHWRPEIRAALSRFDL